MTMNANSEVRQAALHSVSLWRDEVNSIHLGEFLRSGQPEQLRRLGAEAIGRVKASNLASLLLARASRRLRESAIRKALGASRAGLIGQMLLEALPLALVGGVVGVGAAYLALRALILQAPVDLPRLDEVHIDARVCLFALLLSILTSVIFGLLPAWRAANAPVIDAIRGAE